MMAKETFLSTWHHHVSDVHVSSCTQWKWIGGWCCRGTFATQLKSDMQMKYSTINAVIIFLEDMERERVFFSGHSILLPVTTYLLHGKNCSISCSSLHTFIQHFVHTKCNLTTILFTNSCLSEDDDDNDLRGDLGFNILQTTDHVGRDCNVYHLWI